MTPELSRRLGRVMSSAPMRQHTIESRRKFEQAMELARQWEDLPIWVQAEVERIEELLGA